MTVTVLSHSLSVLHYTPWCPRRITNWCPHLCLLASNQWYHDDQFLSSLMVSLYHCLFFFHKHQHQYFISIIQSMQDDQDHLIVEYCIHQNRYWLHLIYHNRISVCKLNANETVCEIYLWCFLMSKCLCFFS